MTQDSTAEFGPEDFAHRIACETFADIASSSERQGKIDRLTTSILSALSLASKAAPSGGAEPATCYECNGPLNGPYCPTCAGETTSRSVPPGDGKEQAWSLKGMAKYSLGAPSAPYVEAAARSDEELVEIVARAMYANWIEEYGGPDWPKWDAGDDLNGAGMTMAGWRDDARRAIKALPAAMLAASPTPPAPHVGASPGDVVVHGRREDGRLAVTLPKPQWSNPSFLSDELAAHKSAPPAPHVEDREKVEPVASGWYLWREGYKDDEQWQMASEAKAKRLPKHYIVKPLYTESALHAVRQEERERCAKVAERFATCGCGGKHGRCNIDAPPLAIAAAIRAGGA